MTGTQEQGCQKTRCTDAWTPDCLSWQASARLNEHRTQEAGRLVIALACAHADFSDFELFRQMMIRPDCGSQGGAGGRDQLPTDRGDVHGQRVRRCNLCHSRYRDGQNAVLTAHRTCAIRQVRQDHPVDLQFIQTDRGRSDVHNGIDCSDLVEMYLIDRFPVHMCFCLRNDRKHPEGQLQCMSA